MVLVRNSVKWFLAFIVVTFVLSVVFVFSVLSSFSGKPQSVVQQYQEFDGVDYQISNHHPSNYFGKMNYECHGSCYCENEVNERRVLSGGIQKRGMVYFITSVSSLFAYHVAKDYFADKCERFYVDEKEVKCLSVKSEVDSCDVVSDEDQRSEISHFDEANNDMRKRDDENKRQVWTIFGASSPKKGSKEWNDAERLGEFLAEKGYIVRNGGYAGTMEASKIGATNKGGFVEGIICSHIFSDRDDPKGNKLTKTIDHDSLLTRIETLTNADVSGYVVLPGSIGTFTELCVLLNLKCVDAIPQEIPVIVFRQPHEKILNVLKEQRLVKTEDLRSFTIVDTVEECMEKIEELGRM